MVLWPLLLTVWIGPSARPAQTGAPTVVTPGLPEKREPAEPSSRPDLRPSSRPDAAARQAVAPEASRPDTRRSGSVPREAAAPIGRAQAATPLRPARHADSLLRDPFVRPRPNPVALARRTETLVVAQLDLRDPFRAARVVGALAQPPEPTALDLQDPFGEGPERWEPCRSRATSRPWVPVQRPTNVASARKACLQEPGPLRDPFDDATPEPPTSREPPPVSTSADSV